MASIFNPDKVDTQAQEYGVLDTPVDAFASVRLSISESAAFSVPYVVMNALSTVVACYGLLANSTAVVIGAMIIAMLLGPISGIALALVDGNYKLLRKAIVAEAGGALIVLIIAYLIGRIHQDVPLTNEILSRTKPNILDLMIALFGGAAGAYATVSPKVSVGLVGVAIATALVPPLGTCGICLARGDYALAFGGFLLFFTNLVAIQFASSVVMWLHGFHKVTSRQPGQKNYIPVSFGILVILGIVLGVNFSKSLSDQTFEIRTRTELLRALRAYPGVHLADLRISKLTDKVVVTAVVRAPYSLGPDKVKVVEAALPSPKDLKLELHIRSVITKEATRGEYVNDTSDEEKNPDVGARTNTP
ncbi:MAG: TIGR00341 family protein [Chthonomonadales bacterium]